MDRLDVSISYMKEWYSKDKPTFLIKELIICSGLIIIGCVVFSAMPENMGIWGWVLFSIGTFLNVVGVFRLAAMFSEVKSDFGKKLRIGISLVVAVLIQFMGLLYLYSSVGTGTCTIYVYAKNGLAKKVAVTVN